MEATAAVQTAQRAVKHRYLHVHCNITSSCPSHPPAKEQSYSLQKSSQKGRAISVDSKFLGRSYSRSQPVSARNYLISESFAREAQDISSCTQSTLKQGLGARGRKGIQPSNSGWDLCPKASEKHRYHLPGKPRVINQSLLGLERFCPPINLKCQVQTTQNSYS